MKDPKQVAAELAGFFGDACADMAYQNPWKYDDKAEAWRRNAVMNGCQDLPGAYADYLYNDPDLASDLLGDRLYDECQDDDAFHFEAVEALREQMRWMPASLFDGLHRKPVDSKGSAG